MVELFGSTKHVPAHGRGGLVTFGATKVTKNAFIRLLADSLPHKAFARQIRQNQGCNLFSPLRSLRPALRKKFAMPFRRTRSPLFCPISPEADLLKNKHKIQEEL